MSAPAAAPADAPRVGRLERAAIAGVMSRELTVFRHYWPSTTFSSIVQPTIYLLAFGLGFGALVSRIGGLSYVQFVGTGTVATAVLFSSAFPGMFGVFYKVNRPTKNANEAKINATMQEKFKGMKDWEILKKNFDRMK